MWRSYLRTFLLLAVLTVILLGLGQLIGGRIGLFVGLFLAIIINFSSYWFSDRFVLNMYRAKPAPKEKYPVLHEAVEQISKEAGIPKPRVFIVPLPIANAFATGRNTSRAVVAVTEGLLDKLSKEELKGVLAHEISHIRNKDMLIMTIAATIAGVISYIAMMLRFSMMFGMSGEDSGSVIGLILASILAPIAALLVQLAISRGREFLADDSGAKLLRDGKPLASALLKLEESRKTKKLEPRGAEATAHLFIVNPFKASGFANLFRTHPPIAERVKRLRALKF